MFLLFFLLIVSCDFTPPLSEEVLKAQEYVENQEYLKAINEYESILEKNPREKLRIKIEYQLGDIYSIYLSDHNKAVSRYRKIIKYSKDPLWLVKSEERLGEIYYSFLKDYRSSGLVYKKLSSFNPPLSNNDFYLYRYAMSLFNARDLNNALNVFKIISKEQSNKYKIRAVYFEGLCYFESKKWEQAIESLKKYINTEKRKDYIVEAKFVMANAYESSASLKNAYNIYYSILGEYPNTEVVQNRLKAIYSRRIARKR